MGRHCRRVGVVPGGSPQAGSCTAAKTSAFYADPPYFPASITISAKIKIGTSASPA
jgi:hypothetical protein